MEVRYPGARNLSAAGPSWIRRDAESNPPEARATRGNEPAGSGCYPPRYALFTCGFWRSAFDSSWMMMFPVSST